MDAKSADRIIELAMKWQERQRWGVIYGFVTEWRADEELYFTNRKSFPDEAERYAERARQSQRIVTVANNEFLELRDLVRTHAGRLRRLVPIFDFFSPPPLPDEDILSRWQQGMSELESEIRAAVSESADTPPTEANGKGEANGGKHSPTKPKTLRPCDEKALSQYQHAIEKDPSIESDDEAYDWLVEDLKADGIALTQRDNWKRYIGRARTHYGKQKNGPRIGNETHSVVSATRLDTPKRTKADQR